MKFIIHNYEYIGYLHNHTVSFEKQKKIHSFVHIIKFSTNFLNLFRMEFSNHKNKDKKQF